MIKLAMKIKSWSIAFVSVSDENLFTTTPIPSVPILENSRMAFRIDHNPKISSPITLIAMDVMTRKNNVLKIKDR